MRRCYLRPPQQAAVAREVAKQVYVGEKLAPPSFAQASYTCTSPFTPLDLLVARILTALICAPAPPTPISPCLDRSVPPLRRNPVRQFAQQAPHPSFWRKLYESGEYKRWLIYAVEAYGIFKIGEMVGRRHVVGYKLDESRNEALT